MDWDEFRGWSHKAADWGADYRSTLRERPVRARTAPGEIAAQSRRRRPKQPSRWQTSSPTSSGRSCRA